MAVEEQDRWTEIRGIHREWATGYRLLGGLGLVLIGIWIGSLLFAQQQGYDMNLYIEIMGVIVTVVAIDTINRRREERRREDDLKARLVREAGSSMEHTTVRAVEELRNHDWLVGDEGLLKEANLRNANLAGASLWQANLAGTSLKEANLAGADLQYANLERATLWRAYLAGASLWGANLAGAELAHANLERAHLQYANLAGASLWQANLAGTSLKEANLAGTSLWGASLMGAELEVANLARAGLEFANFAGASLKDANLAGAILVGAGATFDEKTILPDGSNWTPDTDMGKYTDPDHPDFWQPEWVKKQKNGRDRTE